jgi:hypothetical protein
MSNSYKLEIPCEEGGRGRCPRCDRLFVPCSRRVVHFCKVPPAARGLGDMVSSVLSFFGITPKRVSRLFGVKECGCEKRRKRLNEIGKIVGIGK